MPERSPLIAWPVALAEEAVRFPDTLRELRVLITQLSEVARKLNETTDFFRASIEPLTKPMVGAFNRVENIERAVSELHGALFAIVGRLPGGKRALRGPNAGDDDADADAAELTLEDDVPRDV